MANINKIRLSGQTYNIQDQNAAKTVELTQAQYDALVSGGTVDPNTFYVITDSQGADLSQYWTSAQTESAITQAVSGKQDTLSAGTGIDITDNVISVTGGGITSGEVQTMIDESVSGKQDTLISGTNIKTINNESILGSGNITIQGGGGGKAIEAGRGISVTTGETADTVSFDLPISATTKGSILIGVSCSANRDKSFVGGQGSVGQGEGSFAFGQNCKASQWSIAVGNGVEANLAQGAVAFGKYNKQNGGFYEADSATTFFSVGNGTGAGDGQRHNAFEIRKNGDIYITSGNTDIKLQDNLGGGGASYSAGTGIDITNDVISVSGVVESSAVTSAITSGSTDSEVPSSKAVYDKLGGLSIVKLTDAEYNALQNKDENTLYVVVSAATPTPSWVSYGVGDEVLAGSYSNLRIPSAVTFDDENSHFDIQLSNGNIAHIGSYCTETQCQEWDCAEYDEETGECIEMGNCTSEYCSIVDEGYCINSSYAFDKDVDSLTHFTFGQDGYWYLNEGFTVEVTGDLLSQFAIEVLPNSI